MKRIIFYILLSFAFIIFHCKDATNKTQENQVDTSNEKDSFVAIEEEQERDLANAYFYVLAPNGLSLRASDVTTSKKLLTIPFGDKVKQTAAVYTVDLSVENIQGRMMEVKYKEYKGYVFSGFLSRYPLLEKDESTKDYIKRLKGINSNVTFTDKPTDPEFHEGIVETTILPNTEWHEAFYIAKAMYSMPNSLTFPNPKGEDQETTVQKDKEDYVWSSELNITRKSSQLNKIQYNWRADGGGYAVIITQPNANLFEIEYTGFAD